MKKIIYKIIITFITLLILTVVYLSTIGIQTNKFNSKIINQIKQIEPNIDLTLQEVSAKLDFFNFGLKVETFDSDLLYQDKIIKILNIRTYISLRSIIDKSFALTEVNLSTKSLKIRDLFSFVRLINNNPKIFIAEQFVKDGSITLDIKLEFDNFGKIKKNYKINGFVKKGKINFVNKMLGRAWAIEGMVKRGEKRGRKIGFPTCNLDLGNYIAPKSGVYSSVIIINKKIVNILTR